jgi:ribosome-associated heat shock protein Hsp15
MIMVKETGVRIDKWLWAARICKTRSQAASECKKGKILIDNIPVKPSRLVQEGEIIIVRKMPVIYTYRVKKIFARRVSAKLVVDFVEDLTPDEEKEKLIQRRGTSLFIRKRGEGRPTKKERRVIERYKNPE